MTVYRIQVNRFGEWINVGQWYRTKEAAQVWRSFVKAAWHGLPTRVKKFETTSKPTESEATHGD